MSLLKRLFGRKESIKEAFVDKTYSCEIEKYKADNLILMSQTAVLQARVVAIKDELAKVTADALESKRLYGIRESELCSYLNSANTEVKWLTNKLVETRKNLRELKSTKKKKKLTK